MPWTVSAVLLLLWLIGMVTVLHDLPIYGNSADDDGSTGRSGIDD
jgi:hypothetical protein